MDVSKYRRSMMGDSAQNRTRSYNRILSSTTPYVGVRSTSEESGAQDSIQQHRMSRLREPSDREMSDPRGSPTTICEQLRYNELDEHSAGKSPPSTESKAAVVRRLKLNARSVSVACLKYFHDTTVKVTSRPAPAQQCQDKLSSASDIRLKNRLFAVFYVVTTTECAIAISVVRRRLTKPIVA
ncbi:uncharacterized protein LOC111244845 isoform X2 [Varroa destructor]|uniref:Uncharacterized protein n=1 Tax=Varroa destructor TaxID=109461 RepID=A0A7M7J7W0_VARDE|nr:uncharacterized protein LOC111244845 isoform X2 [Varroa destructor]